MGDVVFSLHASQVTRWLACPHRAKREAGMTGDRDKHVGAVIGDRVHGAITGHEASVPERIVYDDITPTAEALTKQSRKMAGETHYVIRERLKMEVVDSEKPMQMALRTSKDRVVHLQGRIDLIMKDEASGLHHLVDIKTGRRKPDAVWAQLAIYAYMHSYCYRDDRIDRATVIWVRRKKGVAGLIEVEGQDINDDFRAEGRRLAYAAASLVAVDAGHRKTPSYINCHDCPVTECSLRYGSHGGEVFRVSDIEEIPL